MANATFYGWLYRGLGLWVTVLLLANLTGCVTISARELEPFTAMPPDERLMNKVRITWEVREDVREHCARGMQMGSEKALMTPPLACAFWNARTQECVVVTAPNTTHAILGHEVRHCFEGHFHK